MEPETSRAKLDEQDWFFHSRTCMIREGGSLPRDPDGD